MVSLALGSIVSAALPRFITSQPAPEATADTAGRLSVAAAAPENTTVLPISASARLAVAAMAITSRAAGSTTLNTSLVPAGSATKPPELDDARMVARVSDPGEPPSKSPSPISNPVCQDMQY